MGVQRYSAYDVLLPLCLENNCEDLRECGDLDEEKRQEIAQATSGCLSCGDVGRLPRCSLKRFFHSHCGPLHLGSASVNKNAIFTYAKEEDGCDNNGRVCAK